MKLKTIEKTISKKMDSWLRTIKNKELREKVSNSLIVTGGCIPSLLLKEDVNDFDVYFKDVEVCAELAKYYLDRDLAGKGITVYFKGMENPNEEVLKALNLEEGQVYVYVPSQGIITRENANKYAISCITNNAISLKGDVQLITRFCGEPEEIHSNYDFVHCTNYYDHKTKKITTNPDALVSIMTKELRYVGSKYPLSSIIRTRKFIKRGWSVNAGQFVKMALQLNSLDLTDMQSLRSQLIGVDAAYFQMFINKLQELGPEALEDVGYVCEIIDKIFDETENLEDEKEQQGYLEGEETPGGNDD